MMIPNGTLRLAYLQAIADALDAGGAAARLKFYTAPQPANGAALTSQTLIGAATLSYPAVASVSESAITLDEIGLLEVAATGEPVWARYETSTGAFVADATVGGAASGADITLSRTDLTAGGYVQLTPTPITYPGV